jgi:hypothetical protein
MDEQQKQLVAKLKDAQNVLVTVSKNPSVDQLAAAIGLTLALNKLDKHATAVYSGQTPSTIEFLKPEETLETNTDSLRDFIIALDKSKADKLRYKVEDQVVRIFITPYRTSISENDLEFSQGDFNVDVVIALGVKEQTDLDEAISAHGRILHDATVSTISIDGQSELGTLNVANTNASSLCELTTRLVTDLGKDILDAQIATALLTGIVAMTDRFSNDRTSPNTMSLSATLMSAGANQQLIANELSEPLQAAQPDAAVSADATPAPQKDPGTLEISHNAGQEPELSHEDKTVELPNVVPQVEDDALAAKDKATHEQSRSSQIHVDEEGKLVFAAEGDGAGRIGKARAVGDIDTSEAHEEPLVARERMIEPPSRSGELTANTMEEGLDVATEELTLPPLDTPLLSHENSVMATGQPAPVEPVIQPGPEVVAPQTSPMDQPIVNDTDAPIESGNEQVIDTEEQTLSDIEKAVGSPHALQNTATATGDDTSIDDARSAVEAALASAGSQTTPDPIMALNAQPLGQELHEPTLEQQVYQPAPGFGTQFAPTETLPGGTPADQTLDMPLPAPASGVSQPGMQSAPIVQPQTENGGLPAAPTVPPPPIFPNT